MKQLDKDWLTKDWIDFEYKRYLLLAYMQEVKRNFDSVRLYPHLSDLIFHYQNLLFVKNNKKLMYENFPKEISRADFESLNFQYKKMVQDADLMRELEETIEFSIPLFKKMMDEGKNIYEWIENHMEIVPIGLTPLNFNEGYVFISEEDQKEIKIYEYQITIFENSNETYRGVHTHYLESVSKRISQTIENLKIELVKKYNKLPNPATYLISVSVTCPHIETLLPIAKRLLVKYVSTAT